MHNTKEKGDIGLTEAIAEFTRNAFHVSLPLSEHLKYDMIAEKEGFLSRVQVRYTSLSKDRKINVKLQSSWSNKAGNHFNPRVKGDYDILAIYCPQTKQCYFIADQEFESTKGIVLRPYIKEQKQKNIRIAEDYVSCDRAFEIWKTLFVQGNNKVKTENLLKTLTRDNIVEMKKTMTWDDIGFVYNVTGNTIRNAAQKYGLNLISLRRGRKYSKYKKDVMKLQKKGGLSQREIAKKIGCSRGTVSYLIKCNKEEWQSGNAADC